MCPASHMGARLSFTNLGYENAVMKSILDTVMGYSLDTVMQDSLNT